MNKQNNKTETKHLAQGPKKAASPISLTECPQRAKHLPRFKDSKLHINNKEEDEYFHDLFKTKHDDSAVAVIMHSLSGNYPGCDTDEGRNTLLKQFDELKPQNYLETLLLSQMIQACNAASKCMNRAFSKDQTFKERELHANLAIKFHRTFVAQIEALQKLRGKGGQKVTVEHIHINEGGQAIVGNIEQKSGGVGGHEK